ncbi:MAG: hypothetical protein WDN03_19565 [Rhizomicrobium sp.]
MREFAPLIGPILALLFIFRRGLKPRRVKVNGLWRYPVIIAALALFTLWRGQAPGLIAVAVYIVAIAAGGALGWFTAQHAELTLDPGTGTITSKPTPFGTAITGAAFLAKFGLDYYVNGGPSNGGPHGDFAVRHSHGLTWFADAALLFVAARSLAQAAHMWIRTRPLLEQLEQHKATRAAEGPKPGDQ